MRDPQKCICTPAEIALFGSPDPMCGADVHVAPAPPQDRPLPPSTAGDTGVPSVLDRETSQDEAPRADDWEARYKLTARERDQRHAETLAERRLAGMYKREAERLTAEVERLRAERSPQITEKTKDDHTRVDKGIGRRSTGSTAATDGGHQLQARITALIQRYVHDRDVLVERDMVIADLEALAGSRLPDPPAEGTI